MPAIRRQGRRRQYIGAAERSALQALFAGMARSYNGVRDAR